ncbi:MAG: hypothetical protein Q9P44_18650, partial [Anaerolineae bacterium]|nr:hypothetical protein [Anaerolineae bacterium]
DNIPTADPDGFDPTSITWTCTASAGASCISGQPAGTGDTGTGAINTFIDVPRDEQIVYMLTATLRPNYSQPTVTNTAALETGESASDTNGIISDPPTGTKVGVVIGGTRIRWTMTWLNTGGAQAATISDTLRPGQTFIGNLGCTAVGTSTTTSCLYDAPTNTVTWQGTIGTGNANRVEIAFDVSVSGDGNYNNVASINMGGQAASTTAAVTIGDANPPSTDNNLSNAQPIIDDPIIVKLVDPVFIQPGELATWTITITNPNAVALTNIQMSDDVPVPLQVVSASATNGTVTVSGQVVRVFINTLAPNETSTITLITRLDPAFQQTIVSNSAFLDAPYIGDSSADIFVINGLPETGEAPWWRTSVLLGLGLLLGLAGFVATRRSWQYIRKQ